MFFYRLLDVPSRLLEKFLKIGMLYVDLYMNFTDDLINRSHDVQSRSFSLTGLEANTERDGYDKDMII